MKILLLMPLDEKSAYMASGIYKSLPKEIKEVTFCMPAFMEYLLITKTSPNWEYALFDSLLSAKHVYEAAKDDNLIIIGNMPKDYKFDAIFNFQDLEESLDYNDPFIDKMREKVASEDILMKLIDNTYNKEDSKLSLHNCIATADFLTAYLQTDPQVDQIRASYEKRLQELKDKKYVELDKQRK